jgi:hypothetical protein
MQFFNLQTLLDFVSSVAERIGVVFKDYAVRETETLTNVGDKAEIGNDLRNLSFYPESFVIFEITFVN